MTVPSLEKVEAVDTECHILLIGGKIKVNESENMCVWIDFFRCIFLVRA